MRQRDPNDRRRHTVRVTPEDACYETWRTLSSAGKLEDEFLAAVEEMPEKSIFYACVRLRHHLPQSHLAKRAPNRRKRAPCPQPSAAASGRRAAEQPPRPDLVVGSGNSRHPGWVKCGLSTPVLRTAPSRMAPSCGMRAHARPQRLSLLVCERRAALALRLEPFAEQAIFLELVEGLRGLRRNRALVARCRRCLRPRRPRANGAHGRPECRESSSHHPGGRRPRADHLARKNVVRCASVPLSWVRFRPPKIDCPRLVAEQLDVGAVEPSESS